ncbi:HIT family protein [Herbaspirillum sp. B65]|uniref:HIT family protein n=1 Tax=Herbaspirillum sp. B65 TaxID=137708 RepID=UPI0005C9AA6F|nr:HIT family protein [Herbaspirillum sp. B65]
MPKFVDTSEPGSCIFCRIVTGELPAAKVYEDASVIAFMDIGQLNPGHVLVAPKGHWENIFDIPPAEAQAVMRIAQQVALAAKAAFDCPGLMLFQANGREGEQTVMHFHLHVVPRHAGDGVGLIWPRKEPGPTLLEQYAGQLRKQLASGQVNSASL